MGSTDLALAARARGMATHLVARATLERLAGAEDPAALARELARSGSDLDPIPDRADAAAIDRAAGSTAARHLRTLDRWRPSRPGVLDVFAADQDRRSLRALMRGAVQGAPAAHRLAGLIPTPTLPARALAALAADPSASAVVKRLVVLAHPDAPRLLSVVGQAHPDLLSIEVALLRGFAHRAAAAARRDRELRSFVAERIDRTNAQNALLLAGGPRDVEPASCFVDGGRRLTRTAFVTAAAAASAAGALDALRRDLATSPLAARLPVVAGDIAQLDRTALVGALDRLRATARREPLGTASVLYVLLRLDAQSRDLRTLAWGAALGTPPAARRRELVTP